MDAALFSSHRCLPRADRARWVRTWLEEDRAPDDLLRLLRSRFSRASQLKRYAELRRTCDRAEVELLTPLDSVYPSVCMRSLMDPPGHIFAIGDLTLLASTPKVAVVGARRGTSRGVRVAELMGDELARHDLVVVSGMALGVDAAAHRGALREGGKTIAVLACGPDLAYPAQNERLYRSICERGLILSEFPPGEPARKHQFVARNRIIAALCAALVVVEASERSGTRTTVEFALEQGREVMAVPGPVDCPYAAGVLRILREGATLVRHGADVIESLGLEPRAARASVLGLGSVPESTTAIARRLGWDLQRTLVALGQAEARGQVRRLAGDRWMVGFGA